MLTFVPSPAHYTASSACSEEIQSNNMFIPRKPHVIVNPGDRVDYKDLANLYWVKLAK